MLRIAACDDNVMSLDSVAQNIDRYFQTNPNFEYETVKYTSPNQLLNDFDSGSSYDIVILDIIMPEALGTDIARKIHALNPKTRIIFITISHDYAIDAYDIGAVHYVTKPVDYEALKQALDRAVPAYDEKAEARLVIHMKNSVLQSIICDDIFYIESIGYRRVVHTKQGVFEEIRQTLTALIKELERLCPGRFFSPYRGYIVNLDAISTITPNHIVMKEGSTILIKRGDYRKIRDIFFSWTFASSEKDGK